MSQASAMNVFRKVGLLSLLVVEMPQGGMYRVGKILPPFRLKQPFCAYLLTFDHGRYAAHLRGPAVSLEQLLRVFICERNRFWRVR